MNAYESIDKNFGSDEFFDVKLVRGSQRHIDLKRMDAKSFERLYVFSMSSFVRNLLDNGHPKITITGTKIDVNMRLFDDRLEWINKIFPPQ